MRIVTIIPARGGSKGIVQKNLTPIKGKPLLYYSVKASLASAVDATFVCTDSKEVAEYAEEYGARVQMRPYYLADDIIMPDPTLIFFASKQKFDILVFIQPTSPLIKAEYIDIGIEMMKTGEYDSVFTVTEDHWKPRWTGEVNPFGWDINKRPRRQDMPKTFIENGMMYVVTREMLLETELRYGGRRGFVKIPLKDSFQVDTKEDLELIEKLL